jgi:hypothetical protein
VPVELELESVVEVVVVDVVDVEASVVEAFVAPPALEVVGAPPLDELPEASSEQATVMISAQRAQRWNMAR